jgi:hypothetical protein
VQSNNKTSAVRFTNTQIIYLNTLTCLGLSATVREATAYNYKTITVEFLTTIAPLMKTIPLCYANIYYNKGQSQDKTSHIDYIKLS